MSSPHSLLSGCKLVASLAGVPWSRAQPIYRALQQGDDYGPLLPVSRGRAIHSADPQSVARFLIALALTDDPSRTAVLVRTFGSFGRLRGRKPTPDDVNFPDTVEDAIADALVEGWPGYSGEGVPTKGLSAVEFEPDEIPAGVRVTYWDKGVYAMRFEPRRRRETTPFAEDGYVASKHIRRKITLEGQLISKINQSLVWPHLAPIGVGPEGEADPEEEPKSEPARRLRESVSEIKTRRTSKSEA